VADVGLKLVFDASNEPIFISAKTDSTVDTHSTSRGRFFRFLQILFLREIVSLTFNGIYLGICKMLEEKIKKSQTLS
jgi:hypothetical protein